LTDEKQKVPVKLKFNKMETNIENKVDFGVLQISSMNSVGKVFDECDIEIHGEDIEIGFNQRLLADALKAVKEEKVLLKLESATKAMVMLPYDKDTDIAKIDADSSKFLYLVLPVRLKD
jgi:DNA polymerase III sliding clamp (beta) subunit (PCNA family)